MKSQASFRIFRTALRAGVSVGVGAALPAAAADVETEIDRIKDVVYDHEKRIVRLEQKSPAPAGYEVVRETTPTAPPPAAATSPPAPTASTRHVVRQGDSTSAIANAHGTTVAAIVAANGLESADRIWVGQELRIPAPVASAPPPAPAATTPPSPAPPVAASTKAPGTHEIQSGETLFRISKLYGTTVRDLQAMNGITDPASIWPGQVIRIPSSGGRGGTTPVSHNAATFDPTPFLASPPATTPGTANAGSHTVAPGETLEVIARRHGTTARKLQEINGLPNPDRLRVGQTLRLGGRPPTQSNTATKKAPSPAPTPEAGAAPDPAPDPPSPPTIDLGGDDFIGYAVRPGETAASIAKLFGIPESKVRRINDLSPTQKLKVGDEILLETADVFPH